MPSDLEQIFPRLAGADFQITSPSDHRYNCIAWAAGDTQRWWWPEADADEGYWPAGVAAAVTREAFVAALATLGYVPCDGEEPEAGWEKIALFAGPDGAPTHAARQLPNGRWTSKLGKREDIEHGLRDLEGEAYGEVVVILRRPVQS